MRHDSYYLLCLNCKAFLFLVGTLKSEHGIVRSLNDHVTGPCLSRIGSLYKLNVWNEKLYVKSV